MENQSLKIKVIVGSTREGRFSDKAGAWVAEELRKQEGVEVEILDLRDYEMPFFNEAVSPAYKQSPYTHEAVARFTQKIAEGDAYVVVTPEYNHSTSGVLKNAFDWVYQEWGKKPISFMSYGSVGGARAVEHLRLIAVELHMAPTRDALHISGERYFPVLFGQKDADELFASLTEPAGVMISELLWWAHALKQARKS